MRITEYEKLLLEDLKRSKGTVKKRVFLDLVVALTGLTGFIILVIAYSHFKLIIISSGLCGGLIGLSIEKLYAKRIYALAVKLYKDKD